MSFEISPSAFLIIAIIAILLSSPPSVNAALDSTCTAQSSFGDYPTLYVYPAACTVSAVTTCKTELTSCTAAAGLKCAAIQACAVTYMACIRSAVQTPAVMMDGNCGTWAMNASSYLFATPTFDMSTPAFRGCANSFCSADLAQGRMLCASSWNFYPSGTICQPWYTVTTTTTTPAPSTVSGAPTTSTTTVSYRQTYLSGNLGLDYSWTSGDDIFWTIDVPVSLSGYWIAVARADADMGPGKGVSCVVGASMCEAILTNIDYTVSGRTDTNVAFISSTTTGGHIYTKFRATASLMDVFPEVSQRVIFAFGTWNVELNTPNQHQPTDRDATSISFIGPALTPSPPTTMPVTTGTTIPGAPTETTSASNRIEYLDGGMGIAFEWNSGADIYWTLDVPQSDSGKWVAVGQADELMGPGNVVACLTGMNMCSAFATTSSNTITSRTDSSVQFISSSTVNSRIYFTVKASAASMGISSNSLLRMIFAKGPFNFVTQTPSQHSPTDRGEDYYYFLGPTTTSAPGSSSSTSTSSSSSSSSSSNSASEFTTDTGFSTMDPTATFNSDMFTSVTPSPSPSPTTTTKPTTTTTSSAPAPAPTTSTTTTTTTTNSAPAPAPTTTQAGTTGNPQATTTETQQQQFTTTASPPATSGGDVVPPPTTTEQSHQQETTTTAATGSASQTTAASDQTQQQQTTAVSEQQQTSSVTDQAQTTTTTSSASQQTTTATSNSSSDSTGTQTAQQESTAISSSSSSPSSTQQQQQETTTTKASSPSTTTITTTESPAEPSTTSATKRVIPSSITPPPTTTLDPVLTQAPPASTEPPQLQFTVVLGPKPGSNSNQPNVQVFRQDLANLLGTATSNIVITQDSAASSSNNTLTLTIVFASADRRPQLQSHFSNLTSSEKIDIGIESMSFAAAPAPEAPASDNDWTMIYVALAFIVVIAIVGIFAYRKISKVLKDQKANSKQSMEDFRKTLMDQYSMDYGEEGEIAGAGAGSAAMMTQEMLSTRRMSQVNNNNSNYMSPRELQNSSKTKKQQPDLEPEEEKDVEDYEDEGDYDQEHGVSNEEREHL